MKEILQGTELELVESKSYLTVGKKYLVLSADSWEVKIKDDDGDVMVLDPEEVEEYFTVGDVPAELEEALSKWNSALRDLNAQVEKVNSMAKDSVLTGYVSEVVLLDTTEDIDEWYESRC